MVRGKVMGQFCRYRNEYVPVQIRYQPGAHGDQAEKMCGRAECPNAKCNLSNAYTGDRSAGHDYLGETGA